MPHTVLIDAFYTGGINGHGGDHRTAQILELLEKAAFEVAMIQKPGLETRRDRVWMGIRSIANLKTLQFILKYPQQTIFSPLKALLPGFQAQIYGQALQNHAGSKLLLWETTKHFAIPEIAKAHRFNVVALPHNLDCFVLDPKQFHQNFDLEVSSLQAADAVFCISREEQWLLKLKGVDADYLPYYPPAAIVERLLEIRELRATSVKEKLLILGSAGNVPTFHGMIEQLQWLQALRTQQEFSVDIVGYRTELLQPHCQHDDFVVHGTATPEELDEFLTHATVALVHQKAAAGVLTRIPELLIAGVPVIANLVAARSAIEFSGLYCYETRSELATLLTQSFEMPEILPRPTDAEKRFIDRIRQLS
ncbi:MAG: hypothetical protein C4288_08755 [Leptolyngbya sp. ERB_1_1]